MNSRQSRTIRQCTGVFVLAVMLAALAGCASVQSRSNMDHRISQKLDRLSVLSEVGSIVYGSGPIKPAVPFPQSFRQSLTAALSKEGVTSTYVDVYRFSSLAAEDRAKLFSEATGDPNVRLTIQISRTATTTYAGFTHVDRVVYDLSLYSVKNNERFWRAAVVIDATFDVPKWNQSTANKFADEMVRLLKKDSLL